MISAPFSRGPASGRSSGDGVAVRRATAADAVALVPLCHQLGFGCTPEVLAARFATQATDASYASWIALDADGAALGFASGHLIRPVEQDAPIAMLLALVTATRARGLGVGRSLSGAFDAWAHGLGASTAFATSGDHRRGAHRAYEAYGYREDGARYVKRWS